MNTFFITGCSGYVGALLVDHLSKRDDVDFIVGLDKESLPKIIQENKKLHFIQKNTADDWEDEVARYNPKTVIHTAWQIRELYNDKPLQNRWNINGSHQVFDFAFTHPSVESVIHFGSVASYGAESSNTTEYRITEKIKLRKSSYLYAEEKRMSEKMLEDIFTKHKQASEKVPNVYVVRPASITGPYGKLRTKFSLQTILRGTAKESFMSRTISKLMSFMPATHTWVRQFVHEDDVISAVEILSFNTNVSEYQIYNLCPVGEVVTAQDMSVILNKKVLYVYPEFIRLFFFMAWHVSRGIIPTPKGAWKTYSYPIVVDGSKITKEKNYIYQYDTKDSFITDNGWYKGQSSI